MEKGIITSYFAADHDRLDHLFKTFQQAKRIDFPKAKTFFRNFRKGLRRHIIWEEDILFPAFEEKSGGDKNFGPTEMMRREHNVIGDALESLHSKVRQANPDSDSEEATLLQALGAHNTKEENVLYPAIDQLVSSEEIALMLAAMEEIPDERWKTCCGSHEHTQPH